MIPLVWILWTVVSQGLQPACSTPTGGRTPSAGSPPGEVGGGAYHAIIGTVLQALVCAVISVPIAIFTAIYLVEYGRGTAGPGGQLHGRHPDRDPLDRGRAVHLRGLGDHARAPDRVGFAVSLSLVLLMIPVVVRSTEEMLKLVPNELREASYALGVPKWRTIGRIVLPTALSGIITGVLLGLARVMGETAPLLILGPYSKSINPTCSTATWPPCRP